MPEANPRRIDVHHHVLPPTFKVKARERLVAHSSMDDRAFLFEWTPEQAVEQMDKFGIATGIASISTPGIWWGNDADARILARECNEFMAEMTRNYPSRFGFFAATPLPDRDGSLKEIEYALDQLKADGVGILTSYLDRWPGDPAFDDVFKEINRRKAVVFVHPTVPTCCVGLIPGVHPATTEYVFDTTRAITSFLVNGTFARYPDIRFIFCHGGGTVMPIAHRISGLGNRPELKANIPNGVLHELKRLFYDTASAANPPNMAALRALVPLSQILFGTDNPYVPIAATANNVDKFGFTEEELAAINRGNALTLFPRLR
ncbi:MAG TPA: amidohydrolase family protein [Stellaceae bacterium]|nr:amidohydrolase family protein [Stellaceae bacterium]